METQETRARLAEGIRQLQSQGDTQGVSRLISAYKNKYKSETRESRIQQGLPVSTEARFNRTGQITPSGGGSLVRDVLKTPARLVATGRGFATGVKELARGEFDTPTQMYQPTKSKYFGNLDPIGARGGQQLPAGQELKDALGAGLDISSFIPVGTGATLAKEVIKQPFKQAIKTTAKAFGREGIIQGALGSAGRSMQEGDTLGETLGKTAVGATVGGLAGATIGAGTQALSRAFTRTPVEFINKKVDDNIRKAFDGTTTDLQTLERNAIQAKRGLGRIITEDIEIPDSNAPIGSGLTKKFDLLKSKPNEFLSAIEAQRNKIAQIGRSSAEEASRAGRQIDMTSAQRAIAEAVNTGDISVPRGKRFMLELQSIGNDPVKAHEWVQNVNLKYGPKYENGRITFTAESRNADRIAQALRQELNKNVYRGEYAQAYGDNQALKKLVIGIAKKANKKVNFGDITSDAGLDAAISVLTGNPAYMARTLADSVFKGIVRNIRNQSGFKAIKKAGQGVEPVVMPTRGVRQQLRLPARSSEINIQKTGASTKPIIIPRKLQSVADANIGKSTRFSNNEIKNFSETSVGKANEAEVGAMEQVITEMLELSEAGKRIVNYDTGIVTGSPSTFPKWLPEDLRSMELFERVVEKVRNGAKTFGVREGRLLQAMEKRANFYKKQSQQSEIDSLSAMASKNSFTDFKKIFDSKMKDFSPFSSRKQPELEKLNNELMDFAEKNQEIYAKGGNDTDLLKKFWQENNFGGEQAFGAVAGIERDEEGNVKFNPEKAALGLGVIGSLKSKAGQNLLKKAGEKIKGVSDDLIQEARKYKSAEEFSKEKIESLVFMENSLPIQKGKALKTLESKLIDEKGNTVSWKDWIEQKTKEDGYSVAFSENVSISKNQAKAGYELVTPRNTKIEIPKSAHDYFEFIKSKTKTKSQLEEIWKKANEPKKPVLPAYKGEKDLTTKILKDLEGKTTVSKQYILDATNRGELKQVEKDLIRDIVSKEGDTVNVSDFAKKVKAELLPLKVKTTSNPKGSDPKFFREQTRGDAQYGGARMQPRYEMVNLPDKLRGNVKNYRENIYESPIKTSAGETHFGGKTDSYFGHTRIEDMADNQTRRVIEVQSDLYQKGNLEREIDDNFTVALRKLGLEDEHDTLLGDIGIKNLNLEQKNRLREIQKQAEDLIGNRKSEVAKLQQYNDPTAHFRMIREEIKKASEDGKTKLQFPTGETAMKIEGLGTRNNWTINRGGQNPYSTLKIEDLKVGQIIDDGRPHIITEVLGDGKFKAIPEEKLTRRILMANIQLEDNIDKLNYAEQHFKELFDNYTEEFDISGKVDTNNPIYKFYEKDVAKYLNKFGGKRVTDAQGVEWIEVPIKKEWAKMPVEAFALAPFGFIQKFKEKREEKNKVNLPKASQGVTQETPKPISTLSETYIGTNYDPLDPDQTRKNPNGEGAVSGVKLDESMVAVPRQKDGLTGMLRLGTVIYIPELDQVFLVADLMNKRYNGQTKIDFVRPNKKKTPDETVNKSFSGIEIIRQGKGYEDTRNFVNSGEWEKLKQQYE